MSIEPFLSAYDPSDLPGGSLDPLGFERGYVFLAERILPGLTNAANRPRYFSVLCAAIAISDEQVDDEASETPRARFERRQAAIMRMERFWALACVLASQGSDDPEPSGVRGIRDAQRVAKKLIDKEAVDTKAEFRLLARQSQYGLLGIYANVAERLCLIERETLSLLPSLGEPLARAFIGDTKIPRALRVAVASGGDVKLSKLTSWGERAHITGKLGAAEADLLQEALQGESVRSRMAELLKQIPPLDIEGGEPELSRLERVEAAIALDEAQRDLFEALRVIRQYEHCYQLCVLVFYRMLWLVNESALSQLSLEEACKDPVVISSYDSFRNHSANLDAVYQDTSIARHVDNGRLLEPLRFLTTLGASATALDFVRMILARHRHVQNSKRDGGRPKMPWIEVDDETIRATLADSQRSDEVTSVDQMLPHVYRTALVDNFHAGSVAQ